jgi:hypothetical protein
MNNLDFEICENKTFRELCKDIIHRSEAKKIQIDMILNDVRTQIKDQNSALMFVPQLKALLDTGVKNDEQLIKLAAVFQRLQSTQIEASGGEGSGLSEEDKEQLLREVEIVKKEIEVPISQSLYL